MKRPLVYFAAPLFTQAEWIWNSALASKLEKAGVEVIQPQAAAEKMLRGLVEFNPAVLFETNTKHIRDADVVLAILDHADPDSGTSWECGFAYAIGRPIIGLRTDLRQGGDADSGVNLMLSESCNQLIKLPLGKRRNISFVSAAILDAIRDLRRS